MEPLKDILRKIGLAVFNFIRFLLKSNHKKPKAIYVGCFILLVVEIGKLWRFSSAIHDDVVSRSSLSNVGFYLISFLVISSVVLVYLRIGVMRFLILGSLLICFLPLAYNDYSTTSYYVFKILAIPLLHLKTTIAWYRVRYFEIPTDFQSTCACGSGKPFNECCIGKVGGKVVKFGDK